MGEVYIRSQNRQKLYCLGGSRRMEYTISFKRTDEWYGTLPIRHVICISDLQLEEIGVYESQERCMEILDEIQMALLRFPIAYLKGKGKRCHIRDKHMLRSDNQSTVVYQMPEK